MDRLACICLALALRVHSLAEAIPPFRLASALGSHMVLEAASSRVWGFAPPGIVINTTLSTQPPTLLFSTTDESGIWRQKLPAMSPGNTPYTLTFGATIDGNVLVFNATDVLFGRVFLCSGQSSESSFRMYG